jgi:hypothetical protein
MAKAKKSGTVTGSNKSLAGSFRAAAAIHKEALEEKVIKDVQIVSRIASALGLRPPIKASTKLAKLIGGDANAWDIALMLMAYPSFREDGLVLQKREVMDADTLGDLGDLVFAWYASDGWTIQ